MEENAKYNPKEIEAKWQKFWLEKGDSKIDKDDETKKKFYILDMFPYPSGSGLHMGHTESYTASDVVYRYKKLQGFNVLHPQGFDAFGLPAENYAIKTGISPVETTKANMANYIRQMQSLGFAYDFSEAAVTCDPEYYKWTQWIFGEFFKNGLVYKKTAKTNWCSSCQTVIANEQVLDGKCERCGTEIEQRAVPSWFFKITDFAEELIGGLDKVDWPEYTKKNQKNWIGKSEGVTVSFEIKISNENGISNFQFPISNKIQNQNDKNQKQFIEVFTTRIDTIYGVTYLVLAPEHGLVQELKNEIKNFSEVEKYIEQAKNKTELSRMEAKEKTGVELQGIKAINPFNNKEVPIFIADYVLAQYGTGAVMAVPAHDERDFEFAKRYDLEIKAVIAVDDSNSSISVAVLSFAKKIAQYASEKKILAVFDGGIGLDIAFGKITRNHDDIDLQVESGELDKWIKYLEEENFKVKKNPDKRFDIYTADNGIFHIDFGCYIDLDKNKNDKDYLIRNVIDEIEFATFKPGEILEYKISEIKRLGIKRQKDSHDLALHSMEAFVEDGFLINSSEYSGLSSKNAREKMAEWLEEKKLGEKITNYRLRDWSISRQRYWGCPIPIVYSPDGEAHLVPEEHLPWKLPMDVDFVPTGTSPLAKSEELKKRTQDFFGAGWTAEYDTMDTFVDSSWYFLRYPDAHNDKEFCSKERLKKWLPVDVYIGGAEHTYMHLLFARFFVKAMHRIGLLDFDEPFLKLRHQGMVLDKEGKKMSKSKGNVINPDEMVEKFGADSVRAYMLFAAPLEDAVMWNEDNIIGVRRFLEKVWKIQYKITNDKLQISNKAQNPNDQNKKLNSLIHKTIKKVGEDIENFRFNTAVSQLMILVNEMEKQEELSITDYELLIILLAPFAPHIAEEIFQEVLGHKESIFLQKWPEFSETLTKDEEINLVLQVNGKVRDMVAVSADISEEEAKEIALVSEKIKKHIADKEIKKIIFVKGKLVNIVVM
ncbi:MAG: class I tRNA ligase family protein [Parcubacteria group bacterium]